jgi:hypothetical protein
MLLENTVSLHMHVLQLKVCVVEEENYVMKSYRAF